MKYSIIIGSNAETWFCFRQIHRLIIVIQRIIGIPVVFVLLMYFYDPEQRYERVLEGSADLL